tara:strand:- start:238 stop:495 length:258 start_codon:yes stop_codon:yes gene_type:complete
MTDSYHTCIDINGEAYIFDAQPKIEMARITMNKLVNMTSPPEVFTYKELKKIMKLLKFAKIKLDVLSLSMEASTNGFITVGIIKT